MLALAGCPGGDGGIGETCDQHSDCDRALQCAAGTCVPRCARAPDCGDGYTCDETGICLAATGQPGDACSSEAECAAGLSCQIDGNTVDSTGHLLASCTAQSSARPPGSVCARDSDCRNGTCALGHCTDLCDDTRDCAEGTSCMEIPRVGVNGALFNGCLPSSGNIVWTIPITAPTANFLFPVPSAAQSAELVFSVDDPAQKVGAQTLVSPSGQVLYTKPCEVQDATCDPVREFYQNIVRHRPELGQSVLGFPSTPSVPIETGAYRVMASSYRLNGTPGSAIPHVTAVVRVDSALLLDLHFYFLDLDAHPCEAAFGDEKLDAAAAQSKSFFQGDFLGELRSIFVHGGIALGTIDYTDVLDHHDLDGLDAVDAGSLLQLGAATTGINVFFVRTLSPVGLQAFGPNPGPAGIANTRQSGIIIGVDTLCYRSWSQLARVTAHELARYMGLHHNVELGTDAQGVNWRDMIDDTDDSPNNLMFYSELGGTDLSPGQREILQRSGVLR
ncbi:MAG TPA: hypothetical protein VFQ53_10105 [Kofleriaceae bacterium]|nr:hypothetical protein [Kofleriaceae bacterium]